HVPPDRHARATQEAHADDHGCGARAGQVRGTPAGRRRADLIWTLEQGLGDAFTPEARESWTSTYRTLAELMRAASGSAATQGRSRRADASAVPPFAENTWPFGARSNAGNAHGTHRTTPRERPRRTRVACEQTGRG